MHAMCVHAVVDSTEGALTEPPAAVQVMAFPGYTKSPYWSLLSTSPARPLASVNWGRAHSSMVMAFAGLRLVLAGTAMSLLLDVRMACPVDPVT